MIFLFLCYAQLHALFFVRFCHDASPADIRRMERSEEPVCSGNDRRAVMNAYIGEATALRQQRCCRQQQSEEKTCKFSEVIK